MIPVVVMRQAGEPILDPAAVMSFAQQHYATDERIRNTWGSLERYQTALLTIFITPSNRAEGYLYANDGSKPIAMAMYSRVMDIHYGLMAQPIMIFIDPDYRKDLKVNRAVSSLVKAVVNKLGVSWYNIPKHPAPDVQTFKARRI